MSKKRGLGAKRGLDTLLNSSKVGRQVVGVIDDAKAIMPKPSDGSVLAHDQLPADESSNDQLSTKMAPQTQAPANHSADQQSAAHHIEPSVLDHQADASEDAPQLAMHACDDGAVSDKGIEAASDEGVGDQSLGEQALDASVVMDDAANDSPNQTASIVSEADDSELTDALSKLAEHQQREILLFWQYGLSMHDDG